MELENFILDRADNEKSTNSKPKLSRMRDWGARCGVSAELELVDRKQYSEMAELNVDIGLVMGLLRKLIWAVKIRARVDDCQITRQTSTRIIRDCDDHPL